LTLTVTPGLRERHRIGPDWLADLVGGSYLSQHVAVIPVNRDQSAGVEN
jgi:hypothetical protein